MKRETDAAEKEIRARDSEVRRAQYAAGGLRDALKALGGFCGSLYALEGLGRVESQLRTERERLAKDLGELMLGGEE